jgi:uncharacterized protein
MKMLEQLLTAVALLFVIEGVLYGLLPSFMKNMAAQIQKLEVDFLRMIGVSSVCFGVAIVWLLKTVL